MASAMPNIDTVDVTNTNIVVNIDSRIDQAHGDRDGADARTSGMAAAASEPNTASKTIRTIGRFHCLGLGDVVFGGGCRGGAECALADDVELDLAVGDLARLVAVDPDLLAQLLGHVDRTGVVEVQLQRHDVGAGPAGAAVAAGWAPP